MNIIKKFTGQNHFKRVKFFSEAVFPVTARLQLTSKGPFWLTGENRGGVLTGSVCVCVRVLHNRGPVCEALDCDLASRTNPCRTN